MSDDPVDRPDDPPEDAQAPPPGSPPPGAPAHGHPAFPYPGYGYGYGYGYPGFPGYGPAGPPPPSNVGWAIAALFLFWPLAIPSFIFSSRVESSWYRGDVLGAQRASHDARTYGLIGVIVGAMIFVLVFILGIVLFAVLAHDVHHFHRY